MKPIREDTYVIYPIIKMIPSGISCSANVFINIFPVADAEDVNDLSFDILPDTAMCITLAASGREYADAAQGRGIGTSDSVLT